MSAVGFCVTCSCEWKSPTFPDTSADSVRKMRLALAEHGREHQAKGELVPVPAVVKGDG